MAEQLIQACSNCGAKLAFSPNDATVTCSHCGAQSVIDRPEDELPKAIESQFIVPAAFDELELERLTYKYMSQGKHTPDDIIEKSEIVLKEIFYVPTYFFQGNYEAKWTATFGYDRLEPYTAYRPVTYTDNQGRQYTQQEPYTAYRVVTDWRPMNGNDSGQFAVQTYAGPQMDQRVLSLIEQTNLENVTEFKVEFISGFELREFTVTPENSYRASGEKQVNSIIDAGVRRHAQGDRQRDWHWTASTQKDTSTVVMPIATSIFEYEGKRFQVWFDGDNPSQQIGDSLPIDTKRKNAITLGFIPFYSSVAVTGILVASKHENIFISIGINLATLLFGFIRRSNIIDFSVSRREASLMQKHAESSTNEHLTDDQLQKLSDSYSTPITPLLAQTHRDHLLIPLAAVFSSTILVIGGVAAPSSSLNSSSDYVTTVTSDPGNDSSSTNNAAPQDTPTPDPAGVVGDGTTDPSTDSPTPDAAGGIGDSGSTASDPSATTTNPDTAGGSTDSGATGGVG